MSQIIQKGKELIRINPSNKNEIQYSVNNGENWNRRSLQSDDFTFLLDCGEELLAITKNGKQISYSKNNGESLSWSNLLDQMKSIQELFNQ